MSEANSGYGMLAFRKLDKMIMDICSSKDGDPMDIERVNKALEKRIFRIDKCWYSFDNVITKYRRAPTKFPTSLEAGNYPSPSLVNLKIYRGTEKAIGVIKFILAEYVSRFQVAYKIPETQIDFLAYEILTDYYMLTLVEIKWFLKKSLTVENMHRIDLNSILVLFENYREIKMQQGQNNSQRMSYEQKKLAEKPMKASSEQIAQLQEALEGKELDDAIMAEEDALTETLHKTEWFMREDPAKVAAAFKEADKLMSREPAYKEHNRKIDDQEKESEQ